MTEAATAERKGRKKPSPSPAFDLPAIADSKVKHLEFLCPAFGPSDGYGNSCEQMSMALIKSGVSVTLAGMFHPTGAMNAPEIFEASRMRPQRGDAIVFYCQPNRFMRQHSGSRKGYGFSMFEATDIPPAWIPGLINVDEVWVPSEWNAEVFARRSPRPVYPIPLGVNAVDFFARKRRRQEKLRFIHFATYAGEVRKGGDLAIDAFLKAFPGRDDVELVVQSTFPHALDKRDPRVIFRRGMLTTRELSDLYAQFDCLLYPSRGEGFGLIPLEAMATGMPAIYPASSGMLSYAPLGLTIGTKLVPCRIGVGRAGSMDWDGLVADWFEPSLEQLVDRLREVDTDYDRVQAKAMDDAATIARDWTWNRTAEAIRRRLEA